MWVLGIQTSPHSGVEGPLASEASPSLNNFLFNVTSDRYPPLGDPATLVGSNALRSGQLPRESRKVRLESPSTPTAAAPPQMKEQKDRLVAAITHAHHAVPGASETCTQHTRGQGVIRHIHGLHCPGSLKELTDFTRKMSQESVTATEGGMWWAESPPSMSLG